MTKREQIAHRLAQAHQENDSTTTVYVAYRRKEIRLLEETNMIGHVVGAIAPLRYDVEGYAIFIVLLHPSDMRKVRAKKKKLPTGWDIDDFTNLDPK